MAEPFVDTNIFLRHITNDNADHSPRSTAYFDRIVAGDLVAHSTDIVIFETIFTLERHYRHPKVQIRDSIRRILSLRGLRIARKDLLNSALDYYVQYNVSFPDAYHALLCMENGWSPIVSFDRGFDRIEGLVREEP